MRKIFRHALTGFVVASFSHFAAAQSVTANPSTGDVNVSPDTNVQANPQIGSGNQSSNTQQSNTQSDSTASGSSSSNAAEDKNPNSPGKGWAKGRERGKGNPQSFMSCSHGAGRAMSRGEAKRGILLCGSGIGVDIIANRYPHVRAALSWEPQIAELSRRHNDSNVLVIPSRFVSTDEAVEIMQRWLATSFEGGRHTRRVEKIDQPLVEEGAGKADAGS